jgi:iron complex outermembrane receptor protein
MNTYNGSFGRGPYLLRGSSMLAIAAAASLYAGSALAEVAPLPVASGQDVGAVEEVVVTGTSIRGVAPVGSNLVSVGREAIDDTSAQTLQQILKSVPSVTGAGAAGQGPAATSYYAPTIHSLGSSASNSTLVLIDGHRFSLGGSPHPLSDPNIVAPIALERVEVLAEGASSVYGSDAVAGVINFITRKRYDGFMATGQAGFGDSYRTYNLGALWGTRWDTGSVMLAYNFSLRDNVMQSSRDFLRPDHRAKGGTNFQSFNCSPATIQPQGVSGIYLTPTSTTTVANSAAIAPCDQSVYSSLIPRERRHNVYAKVEQDLGDSITVTVDGAYSDRQNRSVSSRGSLTSTVFRTGAQANPFYVNPPGILPGTTAGDRQTVRFSADELLGPGAYSQDGSKNYFVTGNLEYRFGRDFRLTVLGMTGKEDYISKSVGTLCQSCANLALNGTTNTSGNLNLASIPGSTVFIQNLPLTAANALDVWNVGAANRTSAEVRERLTDNTSTTRFFHSLQQARIGVDGPLFELPGGAVRIAVGGEYIKQGFDTERTRSNNTGPASRGSDFLSITSSRNVKSLYGELLIPVVGDDNAVPLIRSFSINLSGRHDDYSDVGKTTNPKIAANWELFDGFRLRGNWSKSFVAPAISSLGSATQGGLASFSGYGGQDSGGLNIPLASYPLARQLPGCTAPGQVVCAISNGTVPGLSFNNGNPGLQPQTGKGWSVGFDYAPSYISGFRLQATLFNAKFRGGVTSPNLATVINTPGLNHLLTIYPNCATAAEIAAVVKTAPLNSPLPACVYFIRNGQQQNVVNLDIQGLDIDGEYKFDTDYGTFTVGASVSRFLKFNQNIGGGPTFSVLNTTGFNETFPSLKTQARANIGWEMGKFSADVFANYIGAYNNWSTTTVAPLTRDANGNPNGGGDPVKASTLFDLHLAYDISGGGMLGDTQVFLDATNVFDQTPPFFNTSAGYDRYAASPIGRVITVGIRAAW